MKNTFKRKAYTRKSTKTNNTNVKYKGSFKHFNKKEFYLKFCDNTKKEAIDSAKYMRKQNHLARVVKLSKKVRKESYHNTKYGVYVYDKTGKTTREMI